MWQFDPGIFRQLDDIREMVALQHLAPTREWPLIVMDDRDELFVIREWPNGSMTAYTMPLPDTGESQTS